MSNKTEVLSFDDALNEHKRLLTESLVNFDEGQRVRKTMLDIDSNSADYEYYFQSGQRSKQAEIDCLQNRIDDLKAFCIKGVESSMLSIEYNQALIDLHKILKGVCDE